MQPGVDVCVACAVTGDLLRPEIRPGLGLRAVFRTAVPKAAVDEDGQPGTDEQYVRAPWHRVLRLQPVSQTGSA